MQSHYHHYFKKIPEHSVKESVKNKGVLMTCYGFCNGCLGPIVVRRTFHFNKRLSP